MRYIGLIDSNSTPIFEGDTLEITNIEDMNFDDDFLKSLKIDRLTIDVIPLDGEVGTKLHFKFFSKGKPVLNSEEKAYFQARNKSEEELSEHYVGEKMEEPICYDVESWHDSMTFHHGFIHRKSKTIINGSVSMEGREETAREYRASDLFVTVNGIRHDAHSQFLVELTPKALERVKEVHATLYEGHKTEGDFTHLLVLPKKVGLHNYELMCKPINADGTQTFILVDHCHDKYLELLPPLRKKWEETLDKWIEENEHLPEEEFKEGRKKIWAQALDEFNKLRVSEQVEIRKPWETVFLGLNMSKNLFDFFENEKCKVTVTER